MDAVGAASSIAALVELTFKVTSYLKAVYDAEKDLASYYQETPSLCGLLTTLRGHIECGSAQKAGPWFASVRMLQHGPLAQYQSALENLADKVAPERGLRQKIVQRLAWPFIKEDVKDILAGIERLKSLIVIALEMDHFKLSQAIQDTVLQVKDDTTALRATGEQTYTELAALTNETNKMSATILAVQQDTNQIGSFRSEVLSSEAAKQKADLLKWLSDHDQSWTSQQLSDTIGRYKEGTGLWLLSDPRFQSWERGTSVTPALFCVGMPGAGKTVMSAMVIRHLTQTTQGPDDKVAVAFVFFMYDQRKVQSIEKLLGSLTRQLVDQAAKAPAAIDMEFEEHGKSGSPDVATYQNMLLEAVRCFSRVYFVVDALDEGTQLHMRDLILRIRSLPADKCKLLATSRFDLDIEELFQDDPRLEIRASDLDIKNYATSRLGELSSCVRKSSELQNQVIEGIVASTQGMFLLAQLNMDSLMDKRNVKSLKTALRILPSGTGAYDAAYDLAMRRISEQSNGDYELAQRVFTWVICAMQPLSETNLETALAVEVGEVVLDPDNTIPAVELLSLCAGLVVMDEKARTVRLVHYTTQEYFCRKQEHLLSDPHRALSNVCISYLGLEEFTTRQEMNNVHDQDCTHVAQHPFLAYAAAHWEEHRKYALPLDESDDSAGADQTLSLELRLLGHDDLMACYLKAKGHQETRRLYRQGTHLFAFEHLTGIQYAAGKGLCRHVSALLKLGQNENDAKYGTTPLIEAARSFHEPVLRLLIDAGADLDLKNSRNRTALMVAVTSHTDADKEFHEALDTDPVPERSRQSIVSLLLAAGCDSDHTPLKTSDDNTALMYAAQYGFELVVATMCQAGANVNQAGSYNKFTALHLAAKYGHEGVVETLLFHGSNSELRGGGFPGMTATDLAAENGHASVVGLLLNNGNPAAKEKAPQTAILFAASRGNASTVELMLLNGADPNLQNEYFKSGKSALHLAAENGNASTVSVLLANTCGIDLRDKNRCREGGRTALCLAVINGHASIVRQLLEHGADPSIADNLGMSPALYSAAKKHWAILELLLGTSRIDVDRKSKGGDTILALACSSWNGCPDWLIKRCVLESQHSIDAKDSYGRTPIMWAAMANNGVVVQVLLEANADVHLTDDDGNTVLHLVQNDELRKDPGDTATAILRRLSEAGLDIDTRGSGAVTALMLAADRGHSQRLRFLLKNGADVLLRDIDDWTALTFAAYAGHDSIVTSLLHAGAEQYSDLALIYAAGSGHSSVLHLLISAGVDLEVATSIGTTSLMQAARYGRLEAATTLIAAGARVNARRADGFSPLMLAANSGPYFSNQLIRLLLSAGAIVDLSSENGQTALMLVVMQKRRGESDRAEALHMLLETGADANASTEGGDTALLFAATPKRGNLRPLGDSSRLQDAANRLQHLKVLLGGEANPNAVNSKGDTALIMEVQDPWGLRAATELLKRGADPNLADAEGKTAILHLVSQTSFHYHFHESDEMDQVVQAMVTAGASLRAIYEDNETILMRAARSGSHAVRPLLAAGADPQGTDRYGRNTVMLASMLDNDYGAEAVKLLLDAGVDPLQRDCNGETAFMLVNKTSNSPDTFLLLRSA